MSKPTEPGHYLSAVCRENSSVWLMHARVHPDGFLHSVFLGDRMPENAVFVHIPDDVIEEAQKRAKDAYIEMTVAQLSKLDQWDRRSRLRALEEQNPELYAVILAALPPQ